MAETAGYSMWLISSQWNKNRSYKYTFWVWPIPCSWSTTNQTKLSSDNNRKLNILSTHLPSFHLAGDDDCARLGSCIIESGKAFYQPKFLKDCEERALSPSWSVLPARNKLIPCWVFGWHYCYHSILYI